MAIRNYSHPVVSRYYEALYREQKKESIPGDAVLYGMELEIEAATGTGWDYLSQQGEGSNPVACRDGSLGEEGAELKFRPSVFEEQRRAIRRWWTSAQRRVGGRIMEHLFVPHDNYGIHIHASRSVLPGDVIRRMAALCNGPAYIRDYFLHPWMERHPHEYCQVFRSLEGLLNDAFHDKNIMETMEKTDRAFSPLGWGMYMDESQMNHHMILSSSRTAPTVEFRGYRSSIEVEKIVSKVAHTAALIEFCKWHFEEKRPFVSLFDPVLFYRVAEGLGFDTYLSAIYWKPESAETLRNYPEHLKKMLRDNSEEKV